MDRRLDKYLCAKYQPLYRDRHADMRTTAMCWGFSITGSGWFNILNVLSRHLCRDWIQAKRDYDTLLPRLGKVKWGYNPESDWNPLVTQELIDQALLKIEEERAKIPVASQVKEKYGSLRFSTWGATDEQHAIISLAESMSEVTCEICGAPGKINDSGWLSCRCKKHRDKGDW